MRVERFSLFFRRTPLRFKRGETEYGDRLDPARRLREDHRHEPAGGDPAGGRAPRLLPPAGVEADRRDRRRAGRQHRARVPDPVGAVSGRSATGEAEPTTGSSRSTSKAPAAARAQAGRPHRRRRRRARRPGRRCASRSPTHKCAGEPSERLQGRRRRSRSTFERGGEQRTIEAYARSTTPSASGTLLGFAFDSDAAAGRAGRRAARLSVDEMWDFTTRDGRARSRRSSRPRSARRSRASSAPTR